MSLLPAASLARALVDPPEGDSGGHLTTLRDRLRRIHFEACGQPKPDPVGLARRLFRFEMQSKLEIFVGAAETYTRILGGKRPKEYRRPAEAEGAKIPA